MIAPGKVWRVVHAVGRTRGMASFDVLEGNEIVAQFWLERDARAVVEAHNATGEAVAWQWRPTQETWEMPGSAHIKEGWQDAFHENEACVKAHTWKGEVRPLFAAPPSKIAKVRERRDKWISEQNKFPNSFVYRDYINAADEIIKILEGGA